MLLQLREVAADGAPSLDLAQIVLVPAAGVITAIPLEPAAWIVRMNPAFLSPFFERLRSVHAEIIQLWIVTVMTKLRRCKPIRGKLVTAVR